MTKAVDNPWLERRVLNYAHQGGAREAPSSTLLALRQAVAAGADGLELDVHATADRHLVVCHDATVDRTTNGAGAIAAMTLAELQALDNAYWWVPGEIVAPGRPVDAYPYRGRAPLDGSLRVATLRQVLDEFGGVFLNLDIKQTGPEVQPYEALLAELLGEYGRSDDVIVASFLDGAIDAFSTAAPDVHTSYPTMATVEFWQAVADRVDPPPTRHVALQVPVAFDTVAVVTEPFVAAAHRAGVAVHVWTIDDAGEMARLVDLGVDGIMTDRPRVLEAELEATASRWDPA